MGEISDDICDSKEGSDSVALRKTIFVFHTTTRGLNATSRVKATALMRVAAKRSKPVKHIWKAKKIRNFRVQ